MPQLIGIGGLKEHGKDTFAEGLGNDWKIVGMSDDLFNALLILDPYIDTDKGYVRVSALAESYDYKGIKTFPEVRRLLQYLGTDVGRMLDEDIWIHKVNETVDRHHENGFNVAITGIRFKNEFDNVKSQGGQTVWVAREREDEAADGHVSEASIDCRQFDVEIVNDGDVESLHAKARAFASAT